MTIDHKTAEALAMSHHAKLAQYAEMMFNRFGRGTVTVAFAQLPAAGERVEHQWLKYMDLRGWRNIAEPDEDPLIGLVETYVPEVEMVVTVHVQDHDPVCLKLPIGEIDT